MKCYALTQAEELTLLKMDWTEFVLRSLFLRSLRDIVYIAFFLICAHNRKNKAQQLSSSQVQESE